MANYLTIATTYLIIISFISLYLCLRGIIRPWGFNFQPWLGVDTNQTELKLFFIHVQFK